MTYRAYFAETGEVLECDNLKALYKSALLNCRVDKKDCLFFKNGKKIGEMIEGKFCSV